jgi:nucleoside-diphosphate-sugar epimerase
MAKILVTGVYGCIGTWVTRLLIEQGHKVVGGDLKRQEHRHDFLVKPLPQAGKLLTIALFDVAETRAVRDVIARERPDAVIHLAALQLPFCKANPIGAIDINVRGVMNFLELAREYKFNFVYASSTAVYGPGDGKPFGEHERLESRSLYGVLKRTNEEMARIYAQDWGVRSVGLRPWTVYGPGRDQGLTADVTLALYHAARGEPYRIRFNGNLGLSHTADTAAAFIAPALKPRDGAHVHTMGGDVQQTDACADLIEELTGRRGLVTVEPTPLGIGCETTDASYQAAYGPLKYRALRDGFNDTLATWRAAAMI